MKWARNGKLLLLPSLLDNPIGSLLDGICVFFCALHMRLLNDECRIWRGPLLRYTKLCSPLASTVSLQTHTCGWHVLVPRRKPAATVTTSSDKRRPTAVRGGACSQSPAGGVVATARMVVDCAWSHYVVPCFLVLISRRGWFYSVRLCLPDDKRLADRWVWVEATWINLDGVLKTKRGCGWSQIGGKCQHTSASNPQSALLYWKRCL